MTAPTGSAMRMGMRLAGCGCGNVVAAEATGQATSAAAVGAAVARTWPSHSVCTRWKVSQPMVELMAPKGLTPSAAMRLPFDARNARSWQGLCV
jgi:hypothetical protein